MSDALTQQLLSCYIPEIKETLQAVNALKKCEIAGDTISLELEFDFPHLYFEQSLTQQLVQLIANEYPKHQVTVKMRSVIRAHGLSQTHSQIPNVKNIIAVASGKGGVGKSTTTVNLALALAQMGANVGILDADIYGPNQPHFLGAQAKPPAAEGGMEPIIQHGVQSNSIGYLIDANTPMIWRGPMVSRALQQLAFETNWHDLDYLLVDLPPGTGDIQLTLAQKIPVSGAVIVSTPQEIALLDARKGLEMFNKVNIPVLGVIENMSLHTCALCGHQEAIFGELGAKQMADETDCEFLGQLPLDKKIRDCSDAGIPIVLNDTAHEASQRYQAIAIRLAVKLSLLPRNFSAHFGNVVVE